MFLFASGRKREHRLLTYLWIELRHKLSRLSIDATPCGLHALCKSGLIAWLAPTLGPWLFVERCFDEDFPGARRAMSSMPMAIPHKSAGKAGWGG